MAEALIVLVLSKITATLGGAALSAISSQIGKDASVLLEAETTMINLKSEFVVMEALISQVDVCKSSNRVFEAWLEQVKYVAYQVEDIVDEYAYLTGQTEGRSFIQRTFHHSKNVVAWHNITSNLKQVEIRLQRLTTMKDRYGISITGQAETSTSHYSSRRHLHLSDSSHLIDADDIVGNVEESKKLTDWLLGGNERRIIISIKGMGGLGKTTLASSIYKKQEIRKNFKCHARIVVSQRYEVKDLLRKISKQLFEKVGSHASSEKVESHASKIDTMDLSELVEKLQSDLQEKSYLIVLDDVWDRNVWSLLDSAFPKNEHKSRIIITTRHDDVASQADSDHTISLKILPQEEAWNLFCKKAFWNKKDRTCPENLKGTVEKIVKRCEGLPLAIATVGSLLSCKEMKEQEWKLFDDQFEWQLANNLEMNSVMSVINLSFIVLPSYLKNCFLYCSLFPEDYQIPRKWIIKLWIAEGFIEERGTMTRIEDVAEGYLTELVQRSLLQVVERDVYGRAKVFRMHDLVREAALTISKKEKFAAICDNTSVMRLGEARRVCIRKGGEAMQPSSRTKQLRSFILFDRGVPTSWMNNTSSSFKLLRVLCLRHATNIKKVPSVVGDLFNLYYLDLSHTIVKKVPKSLSKLKNLQTLDVRDSNVMRLPGGVLELTNLRYLEAGAIYPGLLISSNICKLKNLQTLRYIMVDNRDLVENLGQLTQLRSLGITTKQASNMRDLCTSIGKMPTLTNLTICMTDEEKALDLENLEPLPNLERLHLTGKFKNGELPRVFSSFQNLSRLTLVKSELHEDPLSSFSSMSKLVVLVLECAYKGQQLTFCTGWFPKLKQLNLSDMEQLSGIEVQDGTMASLNDLKFQSLHNLKEIPKGIRYLKSNIVSIDMPEEFMESLQRSNQSIVEHIPDIRIVKQKVVLRMSLENESKRTKALRTAVVIPGVTSASLEGQNIIVLGNGIDAIQLTAALRKRVGFAELVSVAPVHVEQDGGKT